MKKIAVIMGMPVVVEIVDGSAKENNIDRVFEFFREVDRVFSPFKKESEVSKINSGELTEEKASDIVRDILQLCRESKRETSGYFDAYQGGKLDPSGLVKGWAINEGAKKLTQKGYRNFYVEIAGDIQIEGYNHQGKKWQVGIQNPFNLKEVVKVVHLTGQGIATSGTYLQGNHIYNPLNGKEADEIAGLTVIGSNVYEADRITTAAFAMGEEGINFIERLTGFEGYMIKKDRTAVMTSGFGKYVVD